MRKEVVAVIIALVCGALAFVIYLKRTTPVSSDAVAPEGVRYIVAAGPLVEGAVLSAGDLTFSLLIKPSTNLNNFFLQKEDVIGKQLKGAVEKNAPILRSQVAMLTPETEGDRSLPIPQGMQAVAFKSTEIDGLTEGMGPGQYVDVMGSLMDAQGKTVPTTLAYSVPVIAVQKKGEEPPQGVTLALLPGEAEKVFNAMTRGKVRINLLSGKGEKPSYEPNAGSIEIIKGIDHQAPVVFQKDAVEGSVAGKVTSRLLKRASESISRSGILNPEDTKSPKGQKGADSYGN